MARIAPPGLSSVERLRALALLGYLGPATQPRQALDITRDPHLALTAAARGGDSSARAQILSRYLAEIAAGTPGDSEPFVSAAWNLFEREELRLTSSTARECRQSVLRALDSGLDPEQELWLISLPNGDVLDDVKTLRALSQAWRQKKGGAAPTARGKRASKWSLLAALSLGTPFEAKAKTWENDFNEMVGGARRRKTPKQRG